MHTNKQKRILLMYWKSGRQSQKPNECMCEGVKNSKWYEWIPWIPERERDREREHWKERKMSALNWVARDQKSKILWIHCKLQQFVWIIGRLDYNHIRLKTEKKKHTRLPVFKSFRHLYQSKCNQLKLMRKIVWFYCHEITVWSLRVIHSGRLYSFLHPLCNWFKAAHVKNRFFQWMNLLSMPLIFSFFTTSTQYTSGLVASSCDLCARRFAQIEIFSVRIGSCFNNWLCMTAQ